MKKFDLRKHVDRFRLILATFELLEKQNSPVKYRNYEVTWKAWEDHNFCKIMLSDEDGIACYYEASWYKEPWEHEKTLKHYEFGVWSAPDSGNFSWEWLRSIYRMIGGTNGQK